nr:relaxase domain-containing protein [Streptomyces agglomeratus]
MQRQVSEPGWTLWTPLRAHVRSGPRGPRQRPRRACDAQVWPRRHRGQTLISVPGEGPTPAPGLPAKGRASVPGAAGHRPRSAGGLRHPLLAVDFVFRPQASLVVVWALGDDKTRRIIERAHERAIAATIATCSWPLCASVGHLILRRRAAVPQPRGHRRR